MNKIGHCVWADIPFVSSWQTRSTLVIGTYFILLVSTGFDDSSSRLHQLTDKLYDSFDQVLCSFDLLDFA